MGESPRASSLLVVAGEPSGDEMGAAVVSRLGQRGFGIGGPALRAAGLETLFDAEPLANMGMRALMRGSAALRAAHTLERELARRRPAAALLIGFSEFNGWLGRRLRARGVRVLWYAPPQAWAWRPWRARAVRRACHLAAVILPFEEAFWREAGVDARYVGHPGLEFVQASRPSVRRRLSFTPRAEYIALLPGSRTQEVRRHLPAMLRAAALVRAERGALDARVVLAPGLARRVAAWAEDEATKAGTGVLYGAAPGVLPAFDAALCASGTATLECALASVPPVIVYRSDAVTAWVARRLVRVEHMGLPNLLLGERAFPELLQEQVAPGDMASALQRLLDDRSRLGACQRVRQRLIEPLVGPGADTLRPSPSARVAALLEPWLR